MNASLPFGFRAGLIAAFLALAACVSDADLRDDDDDDDRRDASLDAREAGLNDARRDTADGSAEADIGVRSDAPDAGETPRPTDGAADTASTDSRTDSADTRADLTDVSADSVVIDATFDIGVDRGADGADATSDTADATPDTGSTPDANDAADDMTRDGDSRDSAASDAGDSSDDGYDSDLNDAAVDGDARSDSGDGNDAGGLVFYEENFDTGLGGFSTPVAVCGVTIPDWSNVAGYAHASEPDNYGVSRITSPTVAVPANTSNVRLRMSHRYAIEQGWDSAQLLVSKNGAAAALVTTFLSGAYTYGGQMNAATCQMSDMPSQYPGWSGNQTEMISVVNLSAAPFNLAPGDTVSITFRMATDRLTDGAGWDINWVTLSASSP